jgi:hypothetical protein
MVREKKRPGAPKKNNPATARFEIRCTPTQKKKWLIAAKKNGQTLANWLKSLADSNT